MRMNWFWMLIIMLAVMILLPAGTCAPAPAQIPDDAVAITVDTPLMTAGVSGDSYVIKAEVADTEKKRQPGLSGRRGLLPGQGMLYVFDPPQKPTFYETRTAFPLTTAFLRHDGTIAKLHATRPRDPEPFSADEPVPFVLQVREGWFRDRSIGVGQRLILPPSLPGVNGPAPDPPPADADTAIQSDTSVAG